MRWSPTCSHFDGTELFQGLDRAHRRLPASSRHQERHRGGGQTDDRQQHERGGVAGLGRVAARLDVRSDDRADHGRADRGADGPDVAISTKAGLVRTDASFDDLLRLVTGITSAGFVDEAQRARVLAFALDGIRTRS